MKRLTDLTIGDLTATPVWRYEGGSGAEAIVSPSGRTSLSEEDDEVFLAATEFHLADSTLHLGFCFPADDSGIDYLQPVIVAPGAHVSFWFDGPIARETLAAQWNAIGKREEEIFPVTFRCRVPVSGREVTGTISHVESSANTIGSGETEPAPERARTSESAAGPSRRTTGSLRRVRPTPARAISPSFALPNRPPRHNVEMMVEFEQGDSHGTGVTRNISRRGMFVRAARAPNVGPSLQLTVHLPSGRKLELKGRVVRSALVTGLSRPAAPQGFGVRLTDQPAEYDELLSRLFGQTK